jgi:hypothetical protein
MSLITFTFGMRRANMSILVNLSVSLVEHNNVGLQNFGLFNSTHYTLLAVDYTQQYTRTIPHSGTLSDFIVQHLFCP